MASFKLITLAALLMFASTLAAQVQQPTFSSLQVQVEGSPYAAPVIVLDTEDRIVVKFDERADERRYLRAELLHCDADWHRSKLLESEYLDGFNEVSIDNYAYSRLTENRYVHYTLTLPNDRMKFKVSGNYIVRVYDEDDPDMTLLEARFHIAETVVPLNIAVTSRTDIDYNDAHHQVALSADLERLDGLYDPIGELTLVLLQNGRQDNIAYITRPQRIVGKTAVYEHQPQLIFDAGNEYRRFETVTTRYPGMGVQRIEHFDPYYHFTLYTDQPRSDERYTYDETQQGRYTVRNAEYDGDSDVEADYNIVHFSLEMPRLVGADIYLDGDLTDRQFSPESHMVYNDQTGCYEKALLLKQGSYNYQYLAVPQGTTTGRTITVEGDKYQTRNEYVALLYHRAQGARNQRLVGATAIFSGQ